MRSFPETDIDPLLRSYPFIYSSANKFYSVVSRVYLNNFQKIQEVLRRSQNYEKFRFSLRYLARFLKMALTLSCLSEYNFSNFPYSGLILPFLLSAMMSLIVV